MLQAHLECKTGNTVVSPTRHGPSWCPHVPSLIL